MVNVIGVGAGNDKTDRVPDQLEFNFDPEELGTWQDAMFAKIVHKCGNHRYWKDWAKDIAEITDRHQMRIRALLEKAYSKGKKALMSSSRIYPMRTVCGVLRAVKRFRIAAPI